MFYKNLFMTSDSKLGGLTSDSPTIENKLCNKWEKCPSETIDQKMKASLILGSTAEKKALLRKPTVWDQVSKQKYLQDLEIENRNAFIR